MEVVKKFWGEERVIVNSPSYCTKELRLAAGFQSSLHRHAVKDEVFYCVSGNCELEVHGDEPPGQVSYFLSPGVWKRIPPGTWHRFKNPFGRDCVIVESSSTHNDEDVERAEPSRRILEVN